MISAGAARVAIRIETHAPAAAVAAASAINRTNIHARGKIIRTASAMRSVSKAVYKRNARPRGGTRQDARPAG